MKYEVRKWKNGWGIWRVWRLFAWRCRCMGPFGWDRPWTVESLAHERCASLSNAAVSGAAEPRTLDGLVGDLRRQVEVMRRIAADTESSLNEGDPVRRAFYDGRCCCLREQAMNIEDIIDNRGLGEGSTEKD